MSANQPGQAIPLSLSGSELPLDVPVNIHHAYIGNNARGNAVKNAAETPGTQSRLGMVAARVP